MIKKFITKNEVFDVSFNQDEAVAILTMQMPPSGNKINDIFVADFDGAVTHALSLVNAKGFILNSAHKEFCIGADLKLVLETENVDEITAVVDSLCKSLRRLELCNKPVVALLSGSAIGGGFEIALGCHRRIALNSPQFRIGFPEVSLGLFPGAGGSQRLPRLIGVQPALENILQAKMLKAPDALAAGFVDEVVETESQLWKQAYVWIKNNPHPKQPWDDSAKLMPGPAAESEEGRYVFMAALAMLEKKTAGAMRAPKLALMSMQEGLRHKFDKGMEVEARYFKQLLLGTQYKDMIRTLWRFRASAAKQEGLLEIVDAKIKTVGIIGSGMMGSGLAAVCVKAGFNVMITDVNENNLEKAKKRCDDYVGRDPSAKFTATKNLLDLAKCDLIIEAVYEDIDLKHKVLQDLEPALKADAIWATNTSALPITAIAEKSIRPHQLIGLHYFSPPEKMPLVEIICSKSTADETLARCLNFTKQLRKIPIVVNDAFGFYTSRVFFAYIMEAAELVAEGYDPLLVEWAAKKSGMAVPPLQVFDEVTLSLMVHAAKASEEYWGVNKSAGLSLINKMVEMGRTGKSAGKGFYDYVDKRRIWSGLADLVNVKKKNVDVDYLQKRLMFVQCAQAAQAIDEGIIRQYCDAEVAAVLGIGFAPQTGGPLTFIDRFGLKNFVNELHKLETSCGTRFKPAKILCDLAEHGKNFIVEK
ncbi:MAG: 3-hydroxyacyl-CoA dehydrogenase NAD-binding domain-containing protein [bacterium]|nr:3-hydroxyacyl-CoA dehydrogenase NAD-binding domain-containing protein [bacterium]